jgi:hypothetical protein
MRTRSFWTKKIRVIPDEEPSVYHGAILPEKAISGKIVRCGRKKAKILFGQEKIKFCAESLYGNASPRARRWFF